MDFAPRAPKPAVVHFLHFQPGPAAYPPLDAIGLMFYAAFFIGVTLLTMRKAAYGACVLIAVVPFAFYQEAFGTEITLEKTALLGVLLGLSAYRDAFAPLAEKAPWRILVAGILVLCAMLISFVHAAHPDPVIRETLKVAEYVLIFCAVVAAYRLDPDRRALANAAFVTTIAVCALALAQEVTGSTSVLLVSGHTLPRITGPLEGPNQLAGYFDAAIPLALAFIVRERSGIARIALFAAICTDILTFSRGGLAGAAIAILAVAFASRSQLRAAIVPITAGIAAGLAVLFSWALVTHSLAVLRLWNSDSSPAGGVGTRPELWRAAITLWREHPVFGVGAGNFELDIPMTGLQGVRTHANSLYLQALSGGRHSADRRYSVARLRVDCDVRARADGIAVHHCRLRRKPRARAAPDRGLAGLLSEGRRGMVDRDGARRGGSHRTRTRASSMRIALLVPAGFLTGAALCAVMLRHAPADVAVDRAQPLVVVTYWQQFGAQMWIAFAIAIAIASIGYVLALRRCRSVAAIAATSALACAAALTFPVVFSSDVYAYAGYGDMAMHGISAYSHARIALRDPLLDAMLWQWGNPPPMCVYGPAFVALSHAIVALFLHLGAAATLWAFRVLACAALVACAPLAYAAFSGFSTSARLAAAAGIALNPLAVWSAAEGHNDVLALAIVLAGFALVASKRPFSGALVVALSALIKAPGAAAAAALAVASWNDRPRFRSAASGATLGIAAVAALAIPLEYGVRAHLAPAGHYFPQFSVQSISIPLTAAAIAALLAAPWIVKLDARNAVPYWALALWIAIPNPYPWYAVWLVPLAFLAWPSRAAWALIAASLLIGVRYYADATTDLPRSLSMTIVAVQIGIPLLILGAHTANARRDRRGIRTPVPDFATPHSP